MALRQLPHIMAGADGTQSVVILRACWSSDVCASFVRCCQTCKGHISAMCPCHPSICPSIRGYGQRIALHRHTALSRSLFCRTCRNRRKLGVAGWTERSGVVTVTCTCGLERVVNLGCQRVLAVDDISWSFLCRYVLCAGYSLVQGPRTCMVRPHPAVWRLIHGILVVYLLFCIFLLFQNVNGARQFLRVGTLAPQDPTFRCMMRLSCSAPKELPNMDCSSTRRMWTHGKTEPSAVLVISTSDGSLLGVGLAD